MDIHKREEALVELGKSLKKTGYHFTTITPESHRRINRRKSKEKASQMLRDIFGWSHLFLKKDLSSPLFKLLEDAEVLEKQDRYYRSKIRFSNIEEDLYIHSAYPTSAPDAVFFGPDTYRFTSLIRRELGRSYFEKKIRLMDLGCGTGAGGIVASRANSDIDEVVFSDINPQALNYSRINTLLAGLPKARFVQSDLLKEVEGKADVIVANPPYLIDPDARMYRNGGGDWGCDLSIRIVKESVKHLSAGGKLILYTGTPIIEGVPVFLQQVQSCPELSGVVYYYDEIDPDVFGEELEQPYYEKVERIAAVAFIATVPFHKKI